MPLIVAEENPQKFLPLTLTRATFELRFGALCPLQRALLVTPDVALRCRPELAAALRARTGLPVNENIEGESFPGLPAPAPWDVLAQSDKLISADFNDWNRRHANGREQAMMTGAYIVGNKCDVHIGDQCFVQPGCVLDVSNGPIIIADNVTAKWSQIVGPVFIGEGCIVEGARVRPGTSLGPHCKVGGEISATIFQSHTTKGHEGFVGHSWVGSWVNFGAGSTTSNLKNTLGTVRYRRDSATLVETERQFVGSTIGDYTRLGIGQLLTAGSNLGVGCNIFGAEIAPKYVPSFSWGGAGKWQEYQLEPFLRTMRSVMKSRNADLLPTTETVLRQIYERTRAERGLFLSQSSTR